MYGWFPSKLLAASSPPFFPLPRNLGACLPPPAFKTSLICMLLCDWASDAAEYERMAVRWEPVNCSVYSGSHVQIFPPSLCTSQLECPRSLWACTSHRNCSWLWFLLLTGLGKLISHFIKVSAFSAPGIKETTGRDGNPCSDITTVV